ncbi:family 43 glycosylhydrolase [Sphingobacterium bambusae]|uniref:Family 43 glycosylhydrolase n=1 Tax=Sphingobacterium bambusae TaxID=662858 RepID=A0ABW6BAW5_9SPHI|nr:family 43 glycosylhydrolase [Sphingobacterium bambusae]WPL48380.1 family 43 glycosylhydrolase [Sphingobacterium bambusae]
MKVISLLFVTLLGCYMCIAQRLGKLPVHDPVLIQQGDCFYLFSTGQGITVASSRDLKNWTREAPVFAEPPAWAVKAVPSFTGHIWAPDISYHNGRYHLYYSVSAFGKNTSCIAVASNKTLDPKDPEFQWVDHGLLLQSFPGSTDWNAIDPNFICDEHGQPYLSFGSFWGGLKLVKLSKDGLRTNDDLTNLPTIASRRAAADSIHSDLPQGVAENAIEAPFIFRHKNGYYYLFASIDYCCKGAASTYKMIVGRSKQLQGPYLDSEGIDMAKGGGKLLLEGNADWHGVGHNAVLNIHSQDYLVFHGYDAKDGGKAKLLMEELYWREDDWPTLLKSVYSENP